VSAFDLIRRRPQADNNNPNGSRKVEKKRRKLDSLLRFLQPALYGPAWSLSSYFSDWEKKLTWTISSMSFDWCWWCCSSFPVVVSTEPKWRI
jgi:hypothetical protein